MDKVYKLYWLAFEKFRQYPEITSLEENQQFCEFLDNLLNTQSARLFFFTRSPSLKFSFHSATVIPNLSLGLSLSSPFLSPDKLDSFMRRMLVSRISRRVLAEHHIALTKSFSRTEEETSEPHVGIIFTALNVKHSVERCTQLLRSRPLQVEDITISSWPEVIVDGHLDAKFPYIREQLEYIVFELLKNAMHATVLNHHKNGVLPPVRVTVVAGENDIGLRISDQGGGLVTSGSIVTNPADLCSFSHIRNASRLETDRIGALRTASEKGVWATVQEQVLQWKDDLEGTEHLNEQLSPSQTSQGYTRIEQEFDRKISRAEEISLRPPTPQPPPASGSDLTEEQWADIEEAAFQAAIAASLAEVASSSNEAPREGAAVHPGPPSPSRRRSPAGVKPLRIEKKNKGSVDLKDPKEQPKWLAEAQASSSSHFQAGPSTQSAASNPFDGYDVAPPPFAETAPSYSHREVAVVGFELPGHAPSSGTSSPPLSPLPDLNALSISASVSEQEHSTRRNALPQPTTHHMERYPEPSPERFGSQSFDSYPQPTPPTLSAPMLSAPTLSAPTGLYQSDQRVRTEVRPPSSPSPSNFNSYWSTPSTPSKPSMGAPLVQFNPSVAYGKSPFRRMQKTPPPVPAIEEPRQEVYRAGAFYNSAVSAHLPSTPQRPAHDRPGMYPLTKEKRLMMAQRCPGVQDQQRINTFSKLNARHGIIEGKLKALKDEKEALDDLGTELELADEDEEVLYKIGETFVHMRPGRARTRLRKDQQRLDKILEDLSTQAGDCQTQMKELKAILYGKFGKSINLDE
ncbi:hypothetical protein H1R20_g15001, partial [Candolleomyces eurysporus]